MSKAERERKNKELQVLVSGYLIRSGYNKKELAVKLGFMDLNRLLLLFIQLKSVTTRARKTAGRAALPNALQ